MRPRRGPLKLAFLSTYPPTECGLATFTQSQVEHLLRRPDVRVGVASVVDQFLPTPPEVVMHQVVRGVAGQAQATAAALNQADVVVVQHEYGIFGGRDGRDVLDVVDRIRVPVLTVLHTVLTDPTPHQHQVVAQLIRGSAALVTMTATARDRLLTGWQAPERMVHVIPHGAHRNDGPVGQDVAADRPKVILTWGLIGPGKGIEWAIRAMADVRRAGIPATYRIVGKTHPRVLEREGEAYREGLVRVAEEVGVSDIVEFDSSYHPGSALRRIVSSADLVLLPYDSREQVTSGVLSEAVVAGKPVVSTAFPHARELLADGAGQLVPQGDAPAIGQALVRALSDERLLASMGQRSRELAGAQQWDAVMEKYLELARNVLSVRTASVA